MYDIDNSSIMLPKQYIIHMEQTGPNNYTHNKYC